MSRKSLYLTLALCAVVPAAVVAQQGSQQQEHVDLNVIHRIKTAEFGAGGRGGGGGGRGGANSGGSQVMDIMWNLTDRYGPRLTNSPQFRAAGDWAVSQMKEWGLAQSSIWKNGPPKMSPAAPSPAGRSPTSAPPWWSLRTCPSSACPLAWTSGTNGTVTGEAVTGARSKAPADLDKYHGKLKGKIVLTVPPLRTWRFPTTPLASRYTAARTHRSDPN